MRVLRGKGFRSRGIQPNPLILLSKKSSFFCLQGPGSVIRWYYNQRLCHEMIHLWQIMNGFKVNHGKRFEDMREKAKAYGYDA